MSSLLANRHFSFVFLFHCNRPNFLTVELYHHIYFFFNRSTVLMFSTYISILIYISCCFQILHASVNVCNCKSVGRLVSFLSSYLLFCWWNCVEIGMYDIISCLLFIFSEICLSWAVGGWHCSTLWPNFQCMLYSLKI